MSKKTDTAVLLIYTGGTIGMVKDYETGALRAYKFKRLMNNIPELDQLDCRIEGISFSEPLDSSDMGPDNWAYLAELIEKNYEKYDGFVVLHGSDTMSYSASALSFMLKGLKKPVIFTGSQLPIGDLRTDAKENLITSIQIASLKKKGKAVIQEVGLYFEYKLYRANRTTKINAEHFEAFESPDYPPLVESGVHLKVNTPFLLPEGKDKFEVSTAMCREVGLIKLFPGMTESWLRPLIEHPEMKALIFETYGAGNGPTATWFLRMVRNAEQRGVLLINTTQCAGGQVAMDQYENGKTLKNIGMIDGKDLTTEAAVAKAMSLLGQGLKGSEFKKWFVQPIRGEMNQN
ncbi:asparaginase [Aureicoccus marinus]|jgi:L-asparaginase|uniref:asparaginase n=1 Tax=Aureicoccus marinus TaxID=754435 RepID=A0A2S7T8A5_9FLAO|nr:asparaginase [Aureicoccus marinus]PQJ15884.1 L-asparaginase 1 [Aureicoccus marinus]